MSGQTTKDGHEAIFGKIFTVSGPVVVAEQMFGTAMHELVYCGPDKLVGEIIKLEQDRATIQVYEETAGLGTGDVVESTGKPLSVELGPGIMGTIYDGIQRPLEAIAQQCGSIWIHRGVSVNALSREKLWPWVPTPGLEVGQLVGPGDVIGTVQENTLITHRVMVPLDVPGGHLTALTPAGDFTVDTEMYRVEYRGEETGHMMYHTWPVYKPRPVAEKMAGANPLFTGQRVLDALFPVVQGGTCAIPGAFGCFAEGTPVLTADGRAVPAEAVKTGDNLLGPDGKPRRVTETMTVSGGAFKVAVTVGDATISETVVDANHVLCLSAAPGVALPDTLLRTPAGHALIPVSDYLALPAALKAALSPVFTSTPAETSIAGVDPGYFHLAGMHLADSNVGGEDPTDARAAAVVASHGLDDTRVGAFIMSEFMIDGTPALPDSVFGAALPARRALLAGMLDTSELQAGPDRTIHTPAASAARTVARLAVMCGVTPVVKATSVELLPGPGLAPIIALTARPTRALPARPPAAVTVTPAGDVPCYGFQLDGDHLHVLPDATVGHNCGKTVISQALSKYSNSDAVVYIGCGTYPTLPYLTQESAETRWPRSSPSSPSLRSKCAGPCTTSWSGPASSPTRPTCPSPPGRPRSTRASRSPSTSATWASTSS